MNKILKGAMVSIASVFIAGSAFAGGHDSVGISPSQKWIGLQQSLLQTLIK